MPHCVLEYSSNLSPLPDFPALFGEIHSFLLATGEFRLADLKSRGVARTEFLVGDDPQAGFAALEISILAGRTDEMKSRISEGAMEILKRAFEGAAEHGHCSLTVSIADLHRASYRRYSTV